LVVVVVVVEQVLSRSSQVILVRVREEVKRRLSFSRTIRRAVVPCVHANVVLVFTRDHALVQQRAPSFAFAATKKRAAAPFVGATAAIFAAFAATIVFFAFAVASHHNDAVGGGGMHPFESFTSKVSSRFFLVDDDAKVRLRLLRKI
jgi:hypothetical protein